MSASRANPLKISIQHAFAEDSFFCGVKTGVRLDNYQPDWKELPQTANVHAMRHRPAEAAQKRSPLRLPLPVNDNLAPLD